MTNNDDLALKLKAGAQAAIDDDCWVAQPEYWDLLEPQVILSLLAERTADKAENASLRQRVAELEARIPNVKPGEVLVTVSGFTGCGKSAVAGEIEIAMRAIGIPAVWTNGDSEKNMTGADWLTAIEMYKPTVRIVEINVPRAGIKLEVGE